MTETERKALVQAVAAAGRRMQDYAIMAEENVLRQSIEAHARAIEQHEAFRQEVSDALEKRGFYIDDRDLGRFIIAKPDPLVEVLEDIRSGKLGYAGETCAQAANNIRTAMKARGYEWRKIEGEG